jgi:hypothetical protein
MSQKGQNNSESEFKPNTRSTLGRSNKLSNKNDTSSKLVYEYNADSTSQKSTF